MYRTEEVTFVTQVISHAVRWVELGVSNSWGSCLTPLPKSECRLGLRRIAGTSTLGPFLKWKATTNEICRPNGPHSECTNRILMALEMVEKIAKYVKNRGSFSR
jgi:hypothetical protein